MSNAKIAHATMTKLVSSNRSSIQKLHLLLFMITIWERVPTYFKPKKRLDRLQFMDVKSRHMKVFTRKAGLWPH